MRITSIQLCDAATVREGLLHVLGAGPTRLGRPHFPAPLGSVLAVQVYANAKELRGHHELIVTVAKVTGETVAEMTLMLSDVQMAQDYGPDHEGQIPFVLPTGAIGLPEPGRYKVNVSFDGKKPSFVTFEAHLLNSDTVTPPA